MVKRSEAALLVALAIGVAPLVDAQEANLPTTSNTPDSTGGSSETPTTEQTASTQANDTDEAVGEESPDETSTVADPPADKRAPGSFDIDEEAATRALERSLVQINALLLPPGKVELSFNTSFGSDATASPLVVPVTDPNDATQTVSALGVAQFERRKYEAALSASVGLPYDSQFGVNIPFVTTNVFSNTLVDNLNTGRANFSIAGIGDMSLSLLKTVIKEKGRRPDVIARLSIDLDTGDDNSDGLSTGSGAVEYTLALNATKRQDPLVFTYQFSHTIATENSGFKAGDSTQLTFGTILAASPYTSVKLSFSQSILGKSEINGTSIEQANRVPASVSLGTSSVIGKSVFIFTDVTTGLNDAAADYSFRIGVSRQFSVF